MLLGACSGCREEVPPQTSAAPVPVAAAPPAPTPQPTSAPTPPPTATVDAGPATTPSSRLSCADFAGLDDERSAIEQRTSEATALCREAWGLDCQDAWTAAHVDDTCAPDTTALAALALRRLRVDCPDRDPARETEEVLRGSADGWLCPALSYGQAAERGGRGPLLRARIGGEAVSLGALEPISFGTCGSVQRRALEKIGAWHCVREFAADNDCCDSSGEEFEQVTCFAPVASGGAATVKTRRVTTDEVLDEACARRVRDDLRAKPPADDEEYVDEDREAYEACVTRTPQTMTASLFAGRESDVLCTSRTEEAALVRRAWRQGPAGAIELPESEWMPRCGAVE